MTDEVVQDLSEHATIIDGKCILEQLVQTPSIVIG